MPQDKLREYNIHRRILRAMVEYNRRLTYASGGVFWLEGTRIDGKYVKASVVKRMEKLEYIAQVEGYEAFEITSHGRRVAEPLT